MRVRVQKWGNSLALRIPKSLATETALGQGTEVDLQLDEGRLIVTRVGPPAYDLGALLDEVTTENLHHSVDTGEPRGSEVW